MEIFFYVWGLCNHGTVHCRAFGSRIWSGNQIVGLYFNQIVGLYLNSIVGIYFNHIVGIYFKQIVGIYFNNIVGLYLNQIVGLYFRVTLQSMVEELDCMIILRSR